MMASASPSPKSPEISEKSKKYDRQLRLWGDHGQHRLETSHVCLINANATGTEILKSLILPGCGSFTIVDGNTVTQEDLGNNFFLDAESLGKNRAEATARLIVELNPDVRGEHIKEQPDTLLTQNSDFFNQFAIVIGCMLSEKTLITLSRILWENKVPFVYVHCIGLIGWIRLQLTEHTVIESHPDSVKEDLRLDAPFPELINYMKSIAIGEWKSPAITCLYKAWQSFKLRGDLPEKGEDDFHEYFVQYCVTEGFQLDTDNILSTLVTTLKSVSLADLPDFMNNGLEKPVVLQKGFLSFQDTLSKKRKEEFLSYFRNKYLEAGNLSSTEVLEAEKVVMSMSCQAFVNMMDSISNEKKEPWLVMLYKAIQSYMQSKGGSQNGTGMDTIECHPCNMRNKKEFKEYLSKYLFALGYEVLDDGYEEVMKAMNNALSPTTIPSQVQQILDDPKSSKPENSKFWILCAALKEFIRENNGQLPVRGSLPDMTADSQKYISLQKVYREKAAKDADDILVRCQQLIQEASLQKVTVKGDEARMFCKEVRNLRLIRGQPFHTELETSPNSILRDIADNTEECDPDKMYYVMLRGVLRFHSEYNTYPGLLDNDVEPDIARFKSCMNKMLTEWNTSTTVAKEDYIHEICRYGAAEIPSVAAFIGGCTAQEVIKILTSQYVPLNHTLIYNAINSTTSTFDITS